MENETKNICCNSTCGDHWESLSIPVFMFVFGVVGNIIAIAVLSKYKRERKESAFYTLVCGLAVTDLLGTCLASPVTIKTYIDCTVLGGKALCNFHSFLLLFFGVAGLSIICAMSVERYLAINHPYFYQRRIDQQLAGWTLFAIYAGNVLFCSFPVFGMGENVRQYPYTWCFINWRTNDSLHASYSFLYAGVSSLLIVVTLVCNVLVCGTLVVMHRGSMGRLVHRDSVKDRWKASTSAEEIQMMLLLIVTSVVVLVCSTPLVVRVFINQITHPAVEKDMGNPNLQAIRIASMNPILDPWVYILLRRAVFHRVMGLAKRAFNRQGNSVVPGSRQAVLYLASDKGLVTMLQAQGPGCPGEESQALSQENQCFGLRDSEETAERQRQTA
ncbi:PE2R4 protein, partial [Polyodon spathula]|nr:prostaglandin E2 receptor EP4 subtype-like [Polyodon spathula]MBN3280620.1 PE2R4 protein [Polyodon spathula]